MLYAVKDRYGCLRYMTRIRELAFEHAALIPGACVWLEVR